MTSQNKIKVLLAQFPLETHSRGLITVAGMLRDAGMEVVLMGNALPEQIVETAVQEYVDAIGISTYCGGELALGSELMKAAEAKKIKEQTAFLLGGIFPPADIPKLKEMGFDGAFLSATKDEIVSCIESAIANKKKGS
jgi:methylmalonyl-CoA mutase C-terminal domain/subunit